MDGWVWGWDERHFSVVSRGCVGVALQVRVFVCTLLIDGWVEAGKGENSFFLKALFHGE